MTTRDRLTLRAGLVVLAAVLISGVLLGLGRGGAGHRLLLRNATKAEITGLVLSVGDAERPLPALPPSRERVEPLALESGQSVGLRFVAGDRSIGKVRTGRLEFGPGEAVALEVLIDRDPENGLLEGRTRIERTAEWPARLRGLLGR